MNKPLKIAAYIAGTIALFYAGMFVVAFVHYQIFDAEKDRAAVEAFNNPGKSRHPAGTQSR